MWEEEEEERVDDEVVIKITKGEECEEDDAAVSDTFVCDQ